ncbi:MAG: pyrophosphatase [uncultured bacterium]|uniref:MazG nucleotide pyrophosphohydrolase n=1 Tax=Candidatus Wolfebacteria bacterium GW2011_GWE2_44_13 TaxID=1619017 RepID=A0A0G1H9K6_9BACT|nr:MAG: pyrophosphatase [uncultured bacterium]KKT43465.1 MAG: MazG nucleotide pyrophosphohydrolase [Candidatus Wolfebacteria bacterium GW2011_GWE2_44_13]
MKQPFRLFQQQIDFEFAARGWLYWSPLSIGGRLIEEKGELAREVNHCYGDKKKRTDEAVGSIELEIGDVAYTLFCLANSMNYVICASGVRTSGYGNDRNDPMSLLNRLDGHAGKLNHSLDEEHTRATICSRISITMKVLRELAESMGVNFEDAISKSITKSFSRDKERFPAGV